MLSRPIGDCSRGPNQAGRESMLHPLPNGVANTHQGEKRRGLFADCGKEVQQACRLDSRGLLNELPSNYLATRCDRQWNSIRGG
jgi:hypothetical protein